MIPFWIDCGVDVCSAEVRSSIAVWHAVGRKPIDQFIFRNVERCTEMTIAAGQKLCLCHL